MKWSTKMLSSRKNMNRISSKNKNRAINYLFKKLWGPRRELPELVPKISL
ncbi:MAG TPA: hypothetical protein VIN10_15135 [Bacteroidales bacterium]